MALALTPPECEPLHRSSLPLQAGLYCGTDGFKRLGNAGRDRANLSDDIGNSDAASARRAFPSHTLGAWKLLSEQGSQCLLDAKGITLTVCKKRSSLASKAHSLLKHSAKLSNQLFRIHAQL